MIFTRFWFIEFAALVVPVYLLLRVPAARFAFLLAACAVFHAHFAGTAGMLPVIVLGIVVYLLARRGTPAACAAGIALCTVALLFYKYTEFLCTGVLGFISPALSARVLDFYHRHNPGIPLGISFFVFEFIHYLYEVRRRRPAITSPFDFAIFTIFFPSLVAGPIKRYDEFLASLKQGIRNVESADITAGLVRIATGYFKKTCIADNLASYVNASVPTFAHLAMFERWVVFLAIAFRILMDFSGYSDIAIGFARLFGVRLPENFNWPYLATNIRSFWQRWHISLSTWIRDYIYIPLGGSRAGPSRRVMNGLIAFGLCGLWHGAAWHYILWGIYHGIGLAISSTYRQMGLPGKWLGIAFTRVPMLGWLVTMIFVCAGWLFFFYPMKQAGDMMLNLLPARVTESIAWGETLWESEPEFKLDAIRFEPPVEESVLSPLRMTNITADGWTTGRWSFHVPRETAFRSVEIEISMPGWPGDKDRQIAVTVNGRKILSQTSPAGISTFTIPLVPVDQSSWLYRGTWITLQGGKKFTLPKPDNRRVFFRVQAIRFK